VAALIERDDAVTGQLAGKAVPVARVGAEPVQQEKWTFVARVFVRPPLDVVKADAVSLQPAVDWFAHRP
jgi:hypothetical protein